MESAWRAALDGSLSLCVNSFSQQTNRKADSNSANTFCNQQQVYAVPEDDEFPFAESSATPDHHQFVRAHPEFMRSSYLLLLLPTTQHQPFMCLGVACILVDSKSADGKDFGVSIKSGDLAENVLFCLFSVLP